MRVQTKITLLLALVVTAFLGGAVQGNLPRVFADQPLRHFFVHLPEGLMELRGGTIHPSKDFQRKSRVRGYLFAGRLWNQPTLSEMSLFTGNEVTVAPLSRAARRDRRENQADSVSF